MSDHHTLSLVHASTSRPLQCAECEQSEASGLMFRLQSVLADDPLQLPETSLHHVTCLPIVILHNATPTGSIERIDGYAALSDDEERALRAELTPSLLRAVEVMRDVQGGEFNRLLVNYVHQQRIEQLQCKACDRLLLDAVELPCCPAYQLCGLCWQKAHLSTSLQVELGGCSTCGTASSLVSLVSCPSCSRAVQVAEVLEDSSMRERVGSKLVRCPNEKHGCEAVVQSKDSNDHRVLCSYEMARQLRRDEREMESGSEEESEEEEVDEEFKGEDVASESDSEEEESVQGATMNGASTTSRSFTLLSTHLSTAPATAVKVHEAAAEARQEAAAANVRMAEVQSSNRQLDSDTQEPGEAVIATRNSDIGTAAASPTQPPPASSAPQPRDGLTPLVSVSSLGLSMAPSIVDLRQQHAPAQAEPQLRSAAESIVAEGSLKRRVVAGLADGPLDPKRAKTDVAVEKVAA